MWIFVWAHSEQVGLLITVRTVIAFMFFLMLVMTVEFFNEAFYEGND